MRKTRRTRGHRRIRERGGKHTDNSKLATAPSPGQIANGRQAVIKVLRRATITSALPLAMPENPFRLEPNEEGLIPVLLVVELEGITHNTRLNMYVTFCEFVNGADGYIRAFNSLTFHQQVLTVILHETSRV